MRVFIVFILFITILSCSKEPSLLDRCIEANTKEINLLNKIKEDQPVLEKLVLDWVEASELNDDEEVIQVKYDALILHNQQFEASLNEKERKIFHKLNEVINENTDNNAAWTWDMTYEFVEPLQIKSVEDDKIQALKKCNSQGIY